MGRVAPHPWVADARGKTLVAGPFLARQEAPRVSLRMPKNREPCSPRMQYSGRADSPGQEQPILSWPSSAQAWNSVSNRSAAPGAAPDQVLGMDPPKEEWGPDGSVSDLVVCRNRLVAETGQALVRVRAKVGAQARASNRGPL